MLPIAGPPVRDGWVAVEHGLVVATGRGAPGLPEAESAGPAFSTQAILPGLVNAHIHLELSWMEGQVPPAAAMPQWVERLMALRRTVGHEPPEPIEQAVRQVRAGGTALVGDVTNTLSAYGPLLDSGLSACVFRELIGFDVEDGDAAVASAAAALAPLAPPSRLRPSIVPHAPYSVSPALFRAISRAARGAVVSVHVGESAAEIELLRSGTGAWRALLEALGSWTGRWTVPGCGPVEYLDRFGLVNERLLAVHCVHLSDDELRRLAHAGATVVTCPRSNRWTGAGTPPIERFYASGVRVAVGTDSLASVEDLNVFGELRAMRQLAPGVPARRILESATRAGADALGFGGELGTIETGKRAELIAVRLPRGVSDVEEYLLGGIEPADVAWLNQG
jgi:cytosine/adenosine deaminase-related metal-dependent hydrolase